VPVYATGAVDCGEFISLENFNSLDYIELQQILKAILTLLALRLLAHTTVQKAEHHLMLMPSGER
jgi:hypothetical protein